MSSKRPARGVLVVLAGLMLASGVIRIAGGAGQAIAENAAAPAEQMEENPTSQGASEPEIVVLLEALNAREASLEERELALANRMQALRVAEIEITARLEELEAAEQSLTATIALADSAAETDLAGLTAVYENMKPADAAALFQEMTPDFAAGFLGRMRPDAAAQILAGLDPVHAYSISVLLAGRNVNVPTE